jgi:hypothetical protein
VRVPAFWRHVPKAAPNVSQAEDGEGRVAEGEAAGLGAVGAVGSELHPAKHAWESLKRQDTYSRKGESQMFKAQLLVQLSTASQTKAVSSPQVVVSVVREAHAVLHWAQTPNPASSKGPNRHCPHALSSLAQAYVGAGEGTCANTLHLPVRETSSSRTTRIAPKEVFVGETIELNVILTYYSWRWLTLKIRRLRGTETTALSCCDR